MYVCEYIYIYIYIGEMASVMRRMMYDICFVQQPTPDISVYQTRHHQGQIVVSHLWFALTVSCLVSQ